MLTEVRAITLKGKNQLFSGVSSLMFDWQKRAIRGRSGGSKKLVLTILFATEGDSREFLIFYTACD